MAESGGTSSLTTPRPSRSSMSIQAGTLVKKIWRTPILRTNLEPSGDRPTRYAQVCRGIIIVDFIDMERKESREIVFQSLMDTLKKDRIKTFAYPISELGLVQLTRKRTRHNVVNLLTETCPNR